MAEYVGLCSVVCAGAANNGAFNMQLTALDGSNRFDSRWFTATQSVKREQLAVALTAVSGGLKVLVALADSDTPYSVINEIYAVTG